MRCLSTQIMEENRNALIPDIYTIIPDLQLQGKEEYGDFQNLLKLQTDSGNAILNNCSEKGYKFAQYTCVVLIREKIVDNVKAATAFWLMNQQTYKERSSYQ